jgi:predicted dinucleotide-binding enzyme
MKVGVLGTGDVGRALGTGFVTLGHDVKMGSRSATNEKMIEWARRAGPRASAGTFADAASFREIVVLATLGVANDEALRLAGTANLRGKILIDTTNPLDFSRGVPPRLAVSGEDSAGERVQRAVPDTLVVKAFNTVGNTLMFRPELPGGPPDMFICGNDEGAKKRVASILKDFG